MLFFLTLKGQSNQEVDVNGINYYNYPKQIRIHLPWAFLEAGYTPMGITKTPYRRLSKGLKKRYGMKEENAIGNRFTHFGGCQEEEKNI